MQEGKKRRRVGRPLTAALACASLLAPVPALAVTGRSSGGTLSPRLAELAKPSVRALAPARQARLLSLARRGPGSLLRQGNRVLVEVRFDHDAAASVEGLRAAGARIVNVSRRYQTVTVAAKPDELRALAGVARVAAVTEVLTPLAFAGTGCPSGATVSEGDAQLRAGEARSSFNLDGNGVTVGILSDSFDQATEAADGSGAVATHAAEDVATGDLPGPGNPCGHASPVNVLENFFPNPEEAEPYKPVDEGRAMAQIVHDLAPGAKLAFASAFNGEPGFAGNIERLARPASNGGAGARVIADDIAYLEEPFFQDGPVAVAASRVTAAGVDYFSAVGNDNLIEEGTGNEIASWEAPKFRDSGECPKGVVTLSEELVKEHGPEDSLNPSHCMDFAPSGPAHDTFGITVEKGATLLVDLQWAEPWHAVETDLDAFLLDSGGKVVAASGADNVNTTEMPFELIGWENTTGAEKEVDLAINNYTGAHTPRLKLALLQNGSGVSKTEYPTSSTGPEPDIVGPTVFGHAGSKDVIGVGAVRFNTNSAPEEYSSRGPVTHYFGPVNGTTAATKLPAPETIATPGVAATDCGVTTFFASFVPEEGRWRFCGTSAAAPHAAAVAALMLQAHPSLSPAGVRAALASTARPVGPFGPDAVGAGLVDAFRAVAAVVPPPAVTITERPPPLGRNPSPSFGFTANRPVSFACTLDGGSPQPCASPFTPALPLADGRHAFIVTGVDAGGLSGASETVSFTVDTTPPRTFFRKRPRKTIRTRHRKARAAFRFGSNEEGVSFTCRVDGGLFRPCGESLARRFVTGPHTLRVIARDPAGNVDPTPAEYRFRVKRVVPQGP